MKRDMMLLLSNACAPSATSIRADHGEVSYAMRFLWCGNGHADLLHGPHWQVWHTRFSYILSL